MDKIQERLKQYLDSKSLTYKDFERLCGLGNGTAAKLSSNTRKTILDRISTNCDLCVDWLLTGEGEMLQPNIQENVNGETKSAEGIHVPLLNLDVRGGFQSNMELSSPYVERTILWPQARRGDFAIAVSGLSMMPNLEPGSLVLLRDVPDWREFLEMPKLYVVELRDDRRLIKEIRHGNDTECFTLHSYNPDFSDQSLPVSLIRRIYKVVGTMARYDF